MKNPFKKIHVMSSDTLIDMVFSEASKKADRLDFTVKKTRYGTTRMKPIEEMAQQKEGVRISSCANRFYLKLMAIVNSVPKKKDVPEIYNIFTEELVGWDNIDVAQGKIKKAANHVRKLQGKYLDKLKKITNTARMRQARKEFYGRLASEAKKVGNSLDFLSTASGILKELPSLKDEPTVILAGLPNVGKTSLLKLITGSKPEIHSYPFTTKGLMMGYLPYRYNEIQFIDTPGLLDRKKKNSIEVQSQIALEKIGQLVIYVFDISETCGYSLEQQMKFYKRMKKETEKPMIAVVNKIDVIGVPNITEITKKIKAIGVSCDSGKGIEEVKKEIIKCLKL
jgi:nucleolar GTP-binding protein